MTTNHTPARWRRIVATAIAAGAMATGALAVSAPANAAPIPEKTIKNECKDAGGSYATSVKAGVRTSICNYKDSDGNPHTDVYTDGNYGGTIDEAQPPPTNSKPGPPALAPNQGLSPQSPTLAGGPIISSTPTK